MIKRETVPAIFAVMIIRMLRLALILVLSSFPLLISLSSCVSTNQPLSKNDPPLWRDFSWQFDGHDFNFGFQLNPKIYEAFRARARFQEYDLFASDHFGKPLIRKITRKLYEHGTKIGLKRKDLPRFIVSFVQNLPYTSDDVTTGHDEYPRFPYETLYDNGGDCEDTSILASAMLYALGYDVALLRFPGHMAVGIKCQPDNKQSFYQYQGIRYCYLETTGENWDIGIVPPQIKDASAQVSPVVTRPSLLTEFVANFHAIDDETIVEVDVLVKNIGSQTAQGTTIFVALKESTTDRILNQTKSRPFRLVPEDTISYKTKNLKITKGIPFRIFVQVQGRNVIADDAISGVLP